MILKEVKDLFKEIRISDIFIYFSLPIIITIIQLFDYLFNISEMLVLNIRSPLIWQFLTSSYTHLSLIHFFNNLNSYLIIGLVLLIISSKINKKKELFVLFLIISFILPFIISLFHFLINPFNVEIMAGSSGLVSAYLGLIPLFWSFLFFKSNENIIKFVLSCFFYVLFAFFFSYYNKIISLFFLLVSLIMLVYINFKEIDFNNFNKLNYLDKTFFLFPVIFFFLSIHIYVFPSELLMNGAIIEYFSHLIGISIGLILSLIYLLIQ